MNPVTLNIRSALLPAALVALAGAAPAQRPPAPPTRLAFTVTDSTLRGPTTFSAGTVVLQLTNRGSRPHLVQLAFIGPGHSNQEALDHLRTNQRMPSWTAPAIGIGPVDPGRTVALTVNLEPVDYLMADPLTAGGRPNYMSGVHAPLRGNGTAAPLPPNIATTGGLIVTDRTFRFGMMLRSGNTWRQVEGPSRRTQVRAGKQAIRIDAGNANVVHSIVLARGGPEVMRDYASWLDGRRPAPPPLYGGISGMPAGQRAFLDVTLPIGPYVLFCPVRHPRYGSLGFESGEFAQFVVR